MVDDTLYITPHETALAVVATSMKKSRLRLHALVVDSIDLGRENATLFTLVRNKELDGMLSSIKYVEERFNNRFHYDWVFMNDKPFTQDFKTNISAAVSGRAIFSEIPKEFWDVPEAIDKKEMQRDMDFLAREQVLYARKVTYRQMCRFNSGFFYKMPIMNNYQYYWRVEPYIRFNCDISEDRSSSS